MSNIGALVQQLIDAGCAADVAAAVIAEAFAAGAASTIHRVDECLSPGAVRTRRWRENKRHQASQNVTKASPRDASPSVTEASPSVTKRHGDVTGDVLHIYKKKEEVREDTEKKERKKKDYMRGSRLGDAWEPSEIERAFAKSQGMTDSDIAAQAGRFRDYWCSKPGQGGVKLDWPATWRNWCRTFCEKSGRAPVEAKTTDPPNKHFGWRPGLPTHEELLARHANPNGSGADHGGELSSAGSEVHRGNVSRRAGEPSNH